MIGNPLNHSGYLNGISIQTLTVEWITLNSTSHSPLFVPEILKKLSMTLHLCMLLWLAKCFVSISMLTDVFSALNVPIAKQVLRTCWRKHHQNQDRSSPISNNCYTSLGLRCRWMGWMHFQNLVQGERLLVAISKVSEKVESALLQLVHSFEEGFFSS